jgi:hypothetical protein
MKMTLTDDMLRDALLPVYEPSATGTAAAVARTIRTTPQRRRLSWPWQVGAAATPRDVARLRTLRLGLLVALLAAALAAAVVGARLLRTAPPVLFIGRGDQMLTMPLEGGSLEPLRSIAGRLLNDISVSPDGRRMFTIAEPSRIAELWNAADVLFDPEAASSVVPMPPGTVPRDAGAWLPDSRHVILPVTQHGIARVVLVDATTGGHRFVSPEGVAVGSFAVDATGTRLALQGQTRGAFELHLVDLGTGASRVLVPHVAGQAPSGDVAWSPVSSTIAFGMLERSAVRLWTVETDGSAPRPRTLDNESAFLPMWSGDGTLIAYNVHGGGAGTCTPGIRVLNVATDEVSIVGASTTALGWSPDGRGLYAEWQHPLAGAPLGGLVILRLDGSVERLLVPYEADDRSTEPCLWYGFYSKSYRGPRS